VLEGQGASADLFFSVPITKIINLATLELRFASPAIRPRESTLDLWVNGTYVAGIPLEPGIDLRAEVALPTDLLTTTNVVTVQLEGSCADCALNRTPWVTVNATTTLSISGSRLPLANDLSLLPIPFFDPAGQRSWMLPFVFSDRPSSRVLEAGSIVASWFGVFSDLRGVKFPVTVGQIPRQRRGGCAQRLRFRAAVIHSVARRPLVLVRDNPRDPYGKLLIVAGDSFDELLTAARGLVTRERFPAHAAFIAPRDVNVERRRKYDAPRWLSTDRPAPIGMYTSAERLTVKGAGSVNIYFRLPPDLFLAARQSVPCSSSSATPVWKRAQARPCTSD